MRSNCLGEVLKGRFCRGGPLIIPFSTIAAGAAKTKFYYRQTFFRSFKTETLSLPDFIGIEIAPSVFTVSEGGQKTFLGFPDSQTSTPFWASLWVSSSKQRPSR